jgi:hypothetical protein
MYNQKTELELFVSMGIFELHRKSMYICTYENTFLYSKKLNYIGNNCIHIPSIISQNQF